MNACLEEIKAVKVRIWVRYKAGVSLRSTVPHLSHTHQHELLQALSAADAVVPVCLRRLGLAFTGSEHAGLNEAASTPGPLKQVGAYRCITDSDRWPWPERDSWNGPEKHRGASPSLMIDPSSCLLTHPPTPSIHSFP